MIWSCGLVGGGLQPTGPFGRKFLRKKPPFLAILGLQPPFLTEWWTKVVMRDCSPPPKKNSRFAYVDLWGLVSPPYLSNFLNSVNFIWVQPHPLSHEFLDVPLGLYSILFPIPGHQRIRTLNSHALVGYKSSTELIFSYVYFLNRICADSK